MRIVAYFVGWLLALPGACLAIFFLAIGHAVAVGNLFVLMWEALLAFLYGLPLVVLVAIAISVMGFFRMGRIVGGGALLVCALGAIAVIVESARGAPGPDEWFFLTPTIVGAVLGGWLLYVETRATPALPAVPQTPR